MKVFKHDGSELPCQPQSLKSRFGLTSTRKVQHVCASGGATDNDFYNLMEATHQITLTGSYRQWIKRISVFEISIASASLPPRPPRPPPLPGLPPTPPSHPPSMCNFTAYTYYSSKRTFKEPCGLSSDECCRKAQSFGNGVNAYEIDDAGCWLLVSKSAFRLLYRT